MRTSKVTILCTALLTAIACSDKDPLSSGSENATPAAKLVTSR